MKIDLNAVPHEDELSSMVLIPDGASVKVVTKLLPIKTTDDIAMLDDRDHLYLHKSKSGDGEYLKFKLTVLAGAHKGTSFFHILGIKGGEGWVRRGLITMRAMIDAHYGYSHDNMTEEAIANRSIEAYESLNNLVIPVQVKLNPETSEWNASNSIARVLTVEHELYDIIMSGIKPDYSWKIDNGEFNES